MKLIQDVMTWFHNEDPACPQLFFLNGIAGIGKSTVASTVASLADEAGELGASHFFSRINGRTNPANVLTSFAFQLANRDPTMKKEIAQALEDDPDAGFQVIKDQLRKLIVEPLARLDPPPPRLLIVIDALDECQEAGADELLSHLLSQLNATPFIKVLITGRPEQHIVSTFTRRKGHQGVVMHDIEQHIMEGDIEIFLRAKLTETQEEYRRIGVEWKWTEQQLAMLVKRGGKLFVYAVTVYKYIKDRIVGDPEAQMKIVLDTKIPPDSTSPYADLDALYLQLIRISIPPSNRDARPVKRFQEVVGTIITLIEPLPIDSLARLTGTNEGQIRVELSKFPSVISAPTSSCDTPEIYHPSFPDFLKDPQRCDDHRFLVIPSRIHARLASSCLTLMTTHLKRDICDIKDPSKLNKEVEGLGDRVQKAIPPWLRYACLHWEEHVINAPVRDPGVMAHLEDFCQRALLYWLEALSVMGCLERATSFLDQIRNWAVSFRNIYER